MKFLFNRQLMPLNEIKCFSMQNTKCPFFRVKNVSERNLSVESERRVLGEGIGVCGGRVGDSARPSRSYNIVRSSGHSQ